MASAGGSQFFQVGLTLEYHRGEQGLELFGGGAAHQLDEPRVFTKWDRIGALLGKGRGEPQVGRQRGTQPGGKHTAADIRQKRARRLVGTMESSASWDGEKGVQPWCPPGADPKGQ